VTEAEWPLWSEEHPVPAQDVQPLEADSAPIGPEQGAAAATAASPEGPSCPVCGAAVSPSASFCETCGGTLTPTVVPPPAVPSGEAFSSQTRRLGERVSALASCPACGGTVAADGYCQVCGAKAPSARDHFTAAPAAWVGGVCDRGVQHHRNEDAMALWAEEDRAVLVVCDGVSTSIDSDVAALAAARKALDVLVTSTSVGVAGDDSRDAAMAQALVDAAHEANEAVVGTTAPDSTNAASATFAAAVIATDRVHHANLGDSRVYFIGAGQQVLLSVDDSMAQAFIEQGMPRAEAEAMPRAHAITKWLGRDSLDIVPRTGVHELTEPGWLVVCSDGLWNYASEPAELAVQLVAASAATTDPVAVAQALVTWANAQGGQDNVTVALARWGGVPAAAASAGRSSLGEAPNDRPGKEQPANG